MQIENYYIIQDLYQVTNNMMTMCAWHTGNESMASSLWFNSEHMPSSLLWFIFRFNRLPEVSLSSIWFLEILRKPGDLSRPGRVRRLLGFRLPWPILQTAQTSLSSLSWYLLVAIWHDQYCAQGRGEHQGPTSILVYCHVVTLLILHLTQCCVTIFWFVHNILYD